MGIPIQAPVMINQAATSTSSSWGQEKVCGVVVAVADLSQFYEGDGLA